MDFIDKVSLKVSAGKGGDGVVAFIREKYRPKGGPGGGDGGDGGSIIFEANEGLSTLLHLKYKKHIKGQEGQKGANKNQHGKNAPDTIIQVPCGTIIKEDNKIIADLKKHGLQKIIAKGGIGGKGNARFATSRNSAPQISENGSLGQSKNIDLELLVLADVGLVGYPSVGKSTIISVISNAKPKIADYHFTTLSPKLGLVKVNESDSFVVADLPGLIKGASLKKGLGTKFLKHITRCRLILHILDASGDNLKDLADDYKTINNELKTFDTNLHKKEMIVVANKIDDLASKAKIAKFKKVFPKINVLEISAIKNQNLDKLIQITFDKLKNIKSKSLVDKSTSSHVNYIFESQHLDEVIIQNKGNGIWIVSGKSIDNALIRNPRNTHQNKLRFYNLINKLGVENKLIKAGAKNGDTIKVGNLVLELII